MKFLMLLFLVLVLIFCIITAAPQEYITIVKETIRKYMNAILFAAIIVLVVAYLSLNTVIRIF